MQVRPVLFAAWFSLSATLGASLLLSAHALAQSATPQNRNPQNNAPQSGTSGLSKTDPANGTSTDPITPGGPGLTGNANTHLPYGAVENRISDRQFLESAVMRALTHMEAGKLALEKSSKDSVKQFARKSMDDYAKIEHELARRAGRQGLAVPGSLDSKHKARIDRLAKLSGAEFDRAYLKDQARSHERDVHAFEIESNEGDDAALKAYALKALPTIQEDWKTAKELSKSELAAK